jgi:hypothetical protein
MINLLKKLAKTLNKMGDSPVLFCLNRVYLERNEAESVFSTKTTRNLSIFKKSVETERK